MHPASRPFPSSFLRYEHCREPYARARPPHGIQLGTRHPTTRTNVPSAKKRLRNFQGLQREQKGCVFRSQQVLPQRALARKEIKNGLHHVGRYPDLKARELSTIRLTVLAREEFFKHTRREILRSQTVYRGINIRGDPAYVCTGIPSHDGLGQSNQRYVGIPSHGLQLRTGLSSCFSLCP